MRRLKKVFTAEELLCLPNCRGRLELVKGKVYEMAPAGGGMAMLPWPSERSLTSLYG